MVAKKKIDRSRVSWLRLAYLFIAALVIYVIVSQVSSLRNSVGQIRHSNLGYDLIVLLATAGSFIMSAVTYYIISPKRLKFSRTLVVEIGINTLNRLLPAGVGALGANYLYLIKSKCSEVQAATTVALNNTMGAVGNALLLLVLVALLGSGNLRSGSFSDRLLILIGLVLIIIVFIFLWFPKLRQKFLKDIHLFAGELLTYRKRKLSLLIGFVSQVGLTLFNVIALYFSLKAVHGHLMLSSLMLAYSFAITLGSIIPTPGGVGSIEAGLVGALVAYHVSLPQAVAGVLVFRLVNFWLPFIAGTPALIWSRRKHYF